MKSLSAQKRIWRGCALVATLVFAVGVLPACTPEPGYKRDPNSLLPFKFVWAPGSRHPQMANVVAGPREGEWVPAPGYAFAGTDRSRVQWQPGLRHPDYPRISAHSKEGDWVADAGYRFKPGPTLETEWAEGVRHPEHPRIRAMAEEGRWLADPGYGFDNPKVSLNVSWAPGMEHPSHPRVMAGMVEGQWIAKPGFRFKASNSWVASYDQSDLSVEWAPKALHPNCATLISADTEGQWLPAPGFKYVSDQPGDFTVVATDDRGARWLEGVVAPGGAAMLASWASQPEQTDGVFAQLGRFLAKNIADALMKGAIENAKAQLASSSSGPTSTISCDFGSLRR